MTSHLWPIYDWMKAQLHISHDLWIVAVKSVTPSLHVQPATPYMSFLLHTYLVIDAFEELVLGRMHACLLAFADLVELSTVSLLKRNLMGTICLIF